MNFPDKLNMNIKEAGQYYSYHSDIEVNGEYFVRYNWIRKIEDQEIKGREFYVILENRELSFYKTTEASNNTKNLLIGLSPSDQLLFKVDFLNPTLCYDSLNKLYSDTDSRNMLLDFFWDLYINQIFTHSKNYKELRSLFDSDDYFAGIISKMIFYRLVKGQDPYPQNVLDEQEIYKLEVSKSQKDYSLFDKVLLQEKNKAVRYFWKYLLEEKHEHLYNYGSESRKSLESFRFRERNNLWFNSLEEELKPVLEIIQADREKFGSNGNLYNFEEKEEYIKLSAKLMVKRYSLLDTIRYILPKKVGKAIAIGFLSFCLITAAFIFYYLIKLNFFISPDDDKQWKMHPDYLKMLLWIFVLGFPVAHFFSILWLKVKKKNSGFSILFPQIYLPRLFIALCSGWLVFLTAEETNNIFDLTDPKGVVFIEWLIAIVTVSMIVLMYNEIKSTASSESMRTLLGRSFKILGLSFLMSFSIGYLFAGDVFNDFKKENQSSMQKLSDEEVDSLQLQMAQLKIELNNIANLSDRLERLNLSSESMSTLTSKMDMNSIFIYLEVVGKGFNSGNANVKYQPKEILKILKENVSHLKRDGVFNKINKVQMPGSLNLSTVLAVNSLNDSINISINSYHTAKWIIRDNLLTTREVLSDSLLLSETALYNLTNPKNVESKYFAQSRKYIKVIPGPPWSLKALFTTNEDVFIPFNQIFTRALLALFLGVLLQLVIQDKTITEPI